MLDQPEAPAAINPTQDTPTTFERSQRIDNAMEQIARTQTAECTPAALHQSLLHAFAEGAWRHGFMLDEARFLPPVALATKATLHLKATTGPTRLLVTMAYEDNGRPVGENLSARRTDNRLISGVAPQVLEVTPYAIKELLAYCMQQGAWRHCVTLLGTGSTRDAKHSRSVVLRMHTNRDRLISLTVAYED